MRFLWCGNDGTVRAKASALKGLEGRIESGIGLTVAMQAMNGLDQLQPVEGMGPVGEVRLVPDPETFRVVPYAPRTGAMLVDLLDLSGQPAPGVHSGTVAGLGAPALNARGDVAFLATVQRGRDTVDAIYLSTGGRLRKVAQRGKAHLSATRRQVEDGPLGSGRIVFRDLIGGPHRGPDVVVLVDDRCVGLMRGRVGERHEAHVAGLGVDAGEIAAPGVRDPEHAG